MAGAGVVAGFAGLVTVAGGCVTVVVGCFTLTLIEVVVDGCVVLVDAVGAVLAVLPSSPLLTASATPTPAAARATRAIAKSHPLEPERERSRAPHRGHACASRATGAPQFGQKLEEGGCSGGGGCADIASLRYASIRRSTGVRPLCTGSHSTGPRLPKRRRGGITPIG
ncbi:MAG TPA: hypothetical protein VN672_09165 [Solirubrobacteraceae bacterium]|nr:hypothetical protein [Solirubrobacteraceae bacterium]